MRLIALSNKLQKWCYRFRLGDCDPLGRIVSRAVFTGRFILRIGGLVIALPGLFGTARVGISV
jgi:hypothetical protein